MATPSETTKGYSWPIYSAVTNGDFESWASSSDANSWTESGTVTQKSSGGVTGDAAELDASSKIYQVIPFVQYGSGSAFEGRNIDPQTPLLLRMNAKPHSSLSVHSWKVQLHLLDENGDQAFVYDWFQTKWVAETTSFAGAYWKGWAQSGDGWIRQSLPWIAAPKTAGAAVDDDYDIRISIETESGEGIQVDDVQLTVYPTMSIAQLAGDTIMCDGLHYPVRYDARADKIVEATLPKPYETSNSPVPTTTQGTSGNLTPDYYYAWCWTHFDDELEEESPSGWAPTGDTAVFYEQLGASNTSIQIDFSAVKTPNHEADKTADNPQIDKLQIFRTNGAATLEEIQQAITNMEWFYDGEIAVGGTHTSDSADGPSGFGDPEGIIGAVSMFNHVSMPIFDQAAVFNNRLYVTGGPTHRLGYAEPVGSGNDRIIGSTTTAPFSYWGRWCDNLYFQFDNEAQRYLIKRFVYEDDTALSTEDNLYLVQDYRGSLTGKQPYRIFPEAGRVWYCEEGRPTEWSKTNWFGLEGAEGKETTLLMASNDGLLACTRDRSFLFNPGQGSNWAQPISNDIGCIGPRSGALVRGVAYWLSEYGVVERRPGSPPEVISNRIQDIFTNPDDPDFVTRSSINQLAEFARGTHYEARQQYLLAVKTPNAKIGCDVVLAYNYFFQTWDIFRLRSELLEWSWSVDDDGNGVLLFQDSFGTMNVWDRGTIDGGSDERGVGLLEGLVVSADTASLTISSDNVLDTENGGLRGIQVYIRSGPGAGQWRTIAQNTATTLYFHEPWTVTPTSASEFVIGSIEFEWNGKDSDLGLPARVKKLRYLNVDHTVENEGGRAEVRVFTEFGATAHSEQAIADDGTVGVTTPSFDTAQGARGHVSGQSARGYHHRLQIRHTGPQKPLTIRRLSAGVEIQEQD